MAELTDHYQAEVTIVLREYNQYNKEINSGVVSITKKIKVQNLSQLGYLFAQLEIAVDNTNNHSQ